jgi:hypothetical protein
MFIYQLSKILKSLRVPETLRTTHGVRTEPSTPYRSRLRERTKDPCPYERAVPTLSQRTSCIGEQCERHRANPSPTYAQRVITSPAQRSTTEGAPWPIPRNCPPSPPPWPLISQPRPRSPSSTTTEHSTPTKERSLRPCPPPSLRTRADAYMCAFAGACMCMRVEPAQEHARPCDVTMGSFSFEAPHLVVPLTWQASRPP